MRFGVCIGNDMTKLATLKKYGYDYAEIGLSSIADWTEEQINDARKKMEETGIFAEACNGFFGFSEGYLTGDQLDMAVVEEYTRRALSKAARLGLKVAVVGSGKARKVQDVSRMEEGKAKFASVLRLTGTIAAEYGIKIVIEPLRRGETNIVNTVADGLEMCMMADHPNVYVLADFYHVAMNGETLDAIRHCGDKLQHTHIARNNPDRAMPVNPEDQPDCRAWADALRENGYDQRMSLEGYIGKEPAEFEETLAKMAEVLKQFG